MSYAQESIRVKRLIDMYRANPRLFNEEQLDELQELAGQTNLTFNRVSTEFDLRNVAESAVGGLVEGFTTIPIGRQPRNTYEALAHSMGHLVGFAPGIAAIPLRGLAAGASRLGMKGVKNAFEKGAFGAQTINKFSVPMFFGDKASDLLNRGITKAGLESLEFMKRGSATRGIMNDAVHLGVASGVSSFWGGPDEILNSMTHGAIAGGAFGGLGNFRQIGTLLKSKNVQNHQRAEQLIKAGVGSMITGLPTTLQEQPIEIQMYQYLLGGFFGYNARPSYEKAAKEFFHEDLVSGRPDRIFYPEKNSEWSKLSKEAQDYVYKQSADQARISMLKMGLWKNEQELDTYLNNEARKRKGDNYKPEDVDNIAREQAGKIIQGGILVDLEAWENPMPEDLGDPRQGSRHQMLVQIFRKPDGTISSIESMPRGGDYRGIRMDAKHPIGESRTGEPAWDIPAEKFDGREIITLQYINTQGVKGSKGTITAFKPFKGRPNFETGKIDYEVSQKDWFAIEDHLNSQNMYIDGGVKDKGVLKVSLYHPDINRVGVNNLIDTLARGMLQGRLETEKISAGEQKRLFNQYRDEVRQNYEDSLAKEYEWFRDAIESDGMRQHVEDIHKKAWKSDVLYEAERHGFFTRGGEDFTQIGKVMNSKVGARNVVERNKREQVFHTKNIPMNFEINGKKDLNITVLEDFIAGKNEHPDMWYKTEITNPDGTKQIVERPFESATDGTIYIRRSVWKQLVEKSGFKSGDEFVNDLLEKTGMLKPTIATKFDGGVMIGKAAGRRASESMDKFMEANDLDLVLMSSAAKHKGGINPVKYDYKDGTYFAMDQMDIRKMPISDLRLDLGVYENPKKSNAPQMLVRQLFGNLNEGQHPGVVEHVFKTIYEPIINGRPEQNTLIESYIKSPSKDFDFKNLDIDSISLKNIHRILTSEGKDLKSLRQYVRDHIMRVDKDKLQEGEADLNFTEDQWRDYIFRNKRIFNTVGTTDAVADGFKATNKFWEHAYKRYIIDRYLRPKWQFSGKGWAAPYDVEVLKDRKVEPGTFLMDNGKKNMPVDFNFDLIKSVYPKIKGNKSKLGHVIRLSEDLNKPDFVNRLKKMGLYSKVKKEVDKFDYEFVVIRVPADSSSGARVLRFKGFTGQEGEAIITHPKDDAYLGGMDKDSDSMFIYHGFDKKTKDAYKSVKNEWEKDGIVIEGKSSALDKVFNDQANEAPYLHPASIFSPSMRKEVARNVYQGNLGIGWAINSRMTVLSWMDMIAANGGNMAVNIHKKKGYGLDYTSDLGQYVLTLKPDASYNVRRYAREMLNRSADAGNYPKMKSYVRFPQQLFEQAFNVEYKPPKWMMDPKYDAMRSSYAKGDFRNMTASTDLGKVHRMNQTMKPNARSKMEKEGSMELHEFQERLGAETIMSENFSQRPKNLISLIAMKAKADGLNKMTFTHPYQSNLSLINKLRTILEKDPLAKELDIIMKVSTNLETKRQEAQSQGGKRADWQALQEMLRKENVKIASFLSLLRKAKAVEQRVLAAGGSKEDVSRNLKVLVKEADKLKLKYRTIDDNPDAEHRNSSFNDYDSDVIELKNRIRETLGKQGMKSEPFEEYLDLYLLSPFLKSQRFGYHSRMPWQSRAISNKAVQEIFKELDVVTEMAKLPESKQVDKLSGLQDYMHQPSGYAKINSGFSKFMGQEFVGDAEFDVRIKRLKDRMAEHPFWAEHPEDAFIQYTAEFEGGIGRDFSTMTKNDVNNLLRFFEYYDPKSKQSWIDNFVKENFPATKDRDPMRIQRIFYYNRPATLDKKTLAYEVNIFKQANVPVKSKDRVVIRDVKRIMSTHGTMREWLSKMVVQSEARASRELDKMDEGPFSNLQNLTPNERVELMNHVVDVIEKKVKIEDIPNYLNKKFEISISKDQTKTFTGKEMIESYVDKVRNDLEQFGNEYIYAAKDWKAVESDIAAGKSVQISDYMRWNKGKFDFNNFYKKVVEPAWHGKDITEIPLEAIYRAQYEHKLEQIIKTKNIKNPSKYRKLWRNNGLKDKKTGEKLETAFKPVGRKDKETYFPHIFRERNKQTKAEKRIEDQYYEDRIQEDLSRVLSNPENTIKFLRAQSKLLNKESAAKLNERIEEYNKTKNIDILREIMEPIVVSKYQYLREGFYHPTQYGESHVHEALTQVDMTADVARIVSDLVKVGFFSRPKNVLERQVEEKPGYMKEYDAIKKYKEGIIKSRFKNLAALMGDRQIELMTEKSPFGKYTKDHAEFYRMYLRDSLGYKTTFSDWVLKAMESSDPLKLKKNLYYQTSDHEMIQKLDRILKFFKTDKLPFKLSSNDQKRGEQLSRTIHHLGALEAKYQLLTLLANTGVATGNLFGGSLNTVTKTGLRNFTRAMNFKYLEKNLLKDIDGNYQLKFKNGKSVKTKEDLKKWAIERGVVEQYIKNELDFNPKLSTIKNKKSVQEFFKDFQNLLLRNPDPNKETIMELARRHGIDEAILFGGSFPMQASERWLRINSFLSHMLQMRDSFHGMAGQVDMNSEAIVRHALKGVEATQFVYHSVGRSAFMRTATGKVLTRFKNYVQNQIGFQREVYKQAKMYGFKPGTKAHDDFQRLFMINAMLMALGSAYAYSLFDVATPPPFDWMVETSELLWGDKRERERAFFGTYPRAIAPLQIITPPIARVPQSLVMLLNGDWERFADYQAWTLFPFGRFARSVDKTFNEPYGTTVGRGMQQFFRLPTDKFVRRYEKKQIEDMRKDYIANTLSDLDQEGEEWDNKEN